MRSIAYFKQRQAIRFSRPWAAQADVAREGGRSAGLTRGYAETGFAGSTTSWPGRMPCGACSEIVHRYVKP
jgi:hypothetical protein